MLVIRATDKMPLSLDPKTKADARLQELYILLNTIKGECPMYRDFGLMPDYLHMPINMAQTAITIAVMDAMSKYMPEIKLENIRFETDPQRGMFGELSPVLEVSDID